MPGIEYTRNCIHYGNRVSLGDNEHFFPFFVCPFWNPVAVALIKYNVVLSDLIGYTCVSRLNKAVFGYRYEVISFDRKYLCRYLFRCTVFFSVPSSFKPVKAVLVQGVNVSKYPMFCEPILCILDNSLNTAFGFGIGSVT